MNKRKRDTVAKEIYVLAATDIIKARVKFREHFKRSILDRSYDKQIRELFEASLTKEAVKLPLELALALALRTDWRKGGNHKLPALTRSARQHFQEVHEYFLRKCTECNEKLPRHLRLSRPKLNALAWQGAERLYGGERFQGWNTSRKLTPAQARKKPSALTKHKIPSFELDEKELEVRWREFQKFTPFNRQ